MRGRALAAAFAVALWLLGTAAFFSAAGCGVEPVREEEPEKAVQLFLQTSMEENAEAAYNLITEESKKGIRDKNELVSGFAETFSSFSVGVAQISGNKARVPVDLEVKSFQEYLSFEVVVEKEGDAWKISLPETASEMERAYRLFIQKYTSGT